MRISDWSSDVCSSDLWAAKFTSDAAWREYDVIFKEPVSGLTTGSPVQYNGIGVGTVRDLSLAPDDPRQVIARVRLRSSTPVLEDTEASPVFIGLNGVAFIDRKSVVEGKRVYVRVAIGGRRIHTNKTQTRAETKKAYI